MRHEYRSGMNALDHRAISFPSSLRSVGIKDGTHYADVAKSSGLGEAVVQRRQDEAKRRAKTKATKAARKRNR